MDKYQAIIDKISLLEKKAAALQDTEKKKAIAQIQKLISLHDLQPADLFPNGKVAADKSSIGTPETGTKKVKTGTRKSSAKRKGGNPPLYRDPVSGKTWTGHGKAPGWLSGVSDRTAFLIASQPGIVSDSAPVKPARKARGKGKRSFAG